MPKPLLLLIIEDAGDDADLMVHKLHCNGFFVDPEARRGRGVGIPAEDIPRVLEPFGQVEGIMTRPHEGVGLGLPLCKRLAELHDGTPIVEGEVGKGTIVNVRFSPERT